MSQVRAKQSGASPKGGAERSGASPKGTSHKILLIYGLLLIAGCATEPIAVTPGLMIPQTATLPILPTNIAGISHRVEKGQTLWRISKMYNVDLEDIIRANRIEDATNIEVGQVLVIPKINAPEANLAQKPGDDFIWPLNGRTINSFGQACRNMVNKGINIEPYANTDVVAARSGRVVFLADDFGVFGKTIMIDHGDGITTVYSRNAVNYAKLGDTVGQGTVIAKAGSAGRDKNIYLHFEIRKGHLPQNPAFYLEHR